MFTRANKTNRVVKTALSVDYKIENMYETVSGVIVDWYKVTRTANKEYRFVDMTETAVIKAALAKVSMYTRTTRKCISRTLDKTCSSLTSDIQPQRNACGSWDLVIKVHEEDSTHSATIPADPASLFTTENARDYDEGEGGIELTALDIYIGFMKVTGISETEFRNGVTVKYTEHPGSTVWHSLSSEYIIRIDKGTDNNWSITFAYPSPLVVDALACVVCGLAESNTVVIGNGE